MNVAIILSGGVGKRFGKQIPKQYVDLCGKPVINYVIDAVIKAKKIDKIILVMDKKYINYIEKKYINKIDFVENGSERVYSVLNALNFIKDNYSSCDRIIITQAVSPFITEKLIDEYIDLLGEYDVVTTAQKCTGELFNISKYEKINRNNYYFCQSPEAFKYDDLMRCIDVDSNYSELIYHYDYEPKICFYTEFKNNVKLTTVEDLEYSKFLMKNNK